MYQDGRYPLSMSGSGHSARPLPGRRPPTAGSDRSYVPLGPSSCSRGCRTDAGAAATRNVAHCRTERI